VGADGRHQVIENLGGRFRIDHAFAGELLQLVAEHVPCGLRGGVAQLFAKLANLFERAGEQSRHLGFERPRIHNLAQRGVGRERQQVARCIERASLQGPRVGIFFHLIGTRDYPLERLKHAGTEFVVGGEEALDGLGVVGAVVAVEVRGVPAGAAEVLVAGGALLAIPARLVHQRDGRQQAQLLHREGDVREVRDGAVAVLEVEGVEELLGLLRADLGERLAHGQRGS